MLSIKTFEEGLEAIENTYANKKFTVKYNEKQYAQWYKLLSNLTDEAFMNATDEWCASEDTLPAPSNIIELSVRLRPQDNTVNITKNKEYCKHCQDTGFIRFHKFSNVLQRNYEYIACCICDMGEQTKSLYKFPQASREKLSLMESVPKHQSVPQPVKANIDKLVEQFSMI